MIKKKDEFIDNIKFDENMDIIYIDYEKEDGIGILKEEKDLNKLKDKDPYKIYIFNDRLMLTYTELEKGVYYEEKIEKGDFISYKESYFFINKKEVTKILGDTNLKRLRIRKGFVNQVEKIQFIKMEG